MLQLFTTEQIGLTKAAFAVQPAEQLILFKVVLNRALLSTITNDVQAFR